jgi:glutamate dehydrogenase
MPFLVDSTLAELAETGCTVRLLLHPTYAAARDGDGRLTGLGGTGVAAGRESLIQVRVARIASPAWRDALAHRLDQVMAAVRAAVVDWRAMLRQAADLAADYRANQPPLPDDAVTEAVAFIDWLADHNFIFLGTRDYVATETGVAPVEGSGLGVLRDPAAKILRRRGESVNSSEELRAFHASDAPLLIAKSDIRSLVHRRVPMDYVGVKRFGPDGTVIGERRFVGLFTSEAYTRSTASIPYLRLKVRQVVTRAGLDPRGHSGKVLLNVLETLPRDEMFQIDADRLGEVAQQVMALVERPRVRVIARRDAFGRFVSVLVHVPRERYTTAVRVRIGDLVEARYGGRLTEAEPAFLANGLARIHFLVTLDDPDHAEPDPAALEAEVAELLRTWDDRFADALGGLGENEADRLGDRFARAFGPAYQDAYAPDQAVVDARRIDGLSDPATVYVDFHDRPTDGGGRLGLKLYRAGGPVPLSERVPILENMGLKVIDERTYALTPSNRPPVYLHDMSLSAGDALTTLTAAIDRRLERLLQAVWTGRADNDGFNRLCLAADLDWPEVAVLRALARYARQIGLAYGLDYVATVLERHADAAAALAALFRARFDPGAVAEAEADARAALARALEAVTSLDDDIILSRLAQIVAAVVRTNFYRRDATAADLPPPVVAFKIDSRAIADMPRPRPFREIWVHGAAVEGVHLRFAPVARGGLRWSDRPEDFRTEVLGLVKAQQVKNAVIVPSGAKGGFVPRRLKPGMARDAWLAEGTAAYRAFVGALLSVTDNLDGDRIVPPATVVRRDGDDPYLVVAADKGTATFSDTANAIARDAGFWLGDAFASGGSAGYDHKKMAITARGAFLAVARHFREMDVDVMTTPVTVIGVGDMSGDVFGNGMLLAPTLKLVAAFDHRDIFLDPDPDPAASLAERQRLFALPRSSWADYDLAAISRGGGVFSRQTKAIALSPEIRARLGIAAERLTPTALIRALLAAPVDLLWFGGIGTYVRGRDETDADVGDRANDAVRIAAADLRAKVVGEGANLGMTQQARIDYGLAGGRCNSDAIDNSAGVNCSDVEVNIKIALAAAVAADRLAPDERDGFLAAMTDEVAELVLANNRTQTRAIGIEASLGAGELGRQGRLMARLEAEDRLDRAVETLPDAAALVRRRAAGQGLSRAEIGVLLAYAKMATKEALVASDLADDPWFAEELAGYFPSAMRERFADLLPAHRLRREIVATRLTNAMIDLGGPTFVDRLAEESGLAVPVIARGFAAAVAGFGLDGLVEAVDTAPITAALAFALQQRLRAGLDVATLWFARRIAGLPAGTAGGLARLVTPVRDTVAALADDLGGFLTAERAAERSAEAARLAEAGVPAEAAQRIAVLDEMLALADVAAVAADTGADLTIAARAVFTTEARLGIARLVAIAARVPVADRYDALVLGRAAAATAAAARRIAAAAIAHPGGLDGWLVDHGDTAARLGAVVAEVVASPQPSVSAFSVAADTLAALAEEKPPASI